MTNRFTPIAELPPLSLLLHARLAAVKILANDARFQGYIVVSDFDGLAIALERELSLNPVEFNDPTCLLTGYNIIHPQEPSMGKHVSVNYAHSIKYSFTGSEELFRFCPDHFEKRSGMIFLPHDHKLQFTLELKGINCWHAEQLAEQALHDTFEAVTAGNEMIYAWLPALRQRINGEVALLRQKYVPLRWIG